MKQAGHPGCERTERLTDYLQSANGQIILTMPDGVLPAFLIEAYNATVAGQCDRAAALVTPEHIERVDQMAVNHEHGGLACLLTLALVLQGLNRQEEALQRYKTLTDIEPHPLLFNEQAQLHRTWGRYSLALHCSRRAREMAPDDPCLFNSYAQDLINAGHLEEGLAVIEQRVEQDAVCPDLHSQLLLCSHYLQDLDQRRLLREHKRWAQMHAPVHLARGHHANSLDPDRCLRVGFLSATFRDHAATFALEALLDGIDRDALELIGYGNIQTPDQVTERLAAKLALYRPVHGMEDRAVADLIQQDQIDILVGVTGHTAGHRLGVLAYKPAPIQVDWGCINTTGMTQVDYRFTDQWFDPPGTDEDYVEELVRLPGGWSCFCAPRDAAPLAPLPALSNGYITFGSFNHHFKINPGVVSLWSGVLRACPGSRLLLKNAAGADLEICQRLYRAFAQHGVSAERIRIFGRVAPEAHWKLYNRVDVALDTHPYNGCITTLDALWMGVPVVSLVGPAWVSRLGLSLLANVGLEKFVAHSSEQYMAKAQALCANLDVLNTIRLSMRQRMLDSPLLDAQRFAQDIADALRQMWRSHCHSQTDAHTARAASSPQSSPGGVAG